MVSQVVIDRDILGWADEHEDELPRKYDKVLQVSKHQDLPQRSFDEVTAHYCDLKGCDLVTGDAKSYIHFFEAGIQKVAIERIGKLEKGDKYIYLVRIEK
jgi:hypothetical protein